MMGGRGVQRRMLQTLDECVALISRHKKSPECAKSYKAMIALITAEYS